MRKLLQNWTRKGWLAAWLQGRRRARQHKLLPAPVLAPQYPSLLVWDWNLANPYKWNVWLTLDGGATYFMPEDYWMYGAARQFAPDGGSELYFIVGVDQAGKEVTHRSNIVRPDDAIAPPEINGGNPEWESTEQGWWDVYIDWIFNHAGHPVAQMEVWLSLNNGPFVQHATVSSGDPGYYYPMAANNETTFDFKVRYRNGATVGPFSNVYQINIQV
jgi:hypothetical protein